MDKEDRTTTVVTVRCIDMAAPFVDTWKRVCDMCGEMTWISASWIGKKIDKVICEPCWFLYCKDENDINICITKANLEEFREWSKIYYGYEKVTIKEAVKMMEMKTGKKIKIVECPKDSKEI